MSIHPSRDYIPSYVDANKKHVILIPGLERLSRQFNAVSLAGPNVNLPSLSSFDTRYLMNEAKHEDPKEVLVVAEHAK